MDELYFETVNYFTLKKQKYLIIYRTNHYVVNYIGWFVGYHATQVMFQKVTCFYSENLNMHRIHCTPYMYFDKNSIFFEMISQKQKIQEMMEHRALLKILRRLIGDDTFYW